MVREFARGARVVGSILDSGPIELYLVPASAQLQLTKAVVCVILAVV